VVVGLLLTGGRSRRIGTEKAQLVLAGETLAHRAARVLGDVCDRVVELGPGYTSLPRVIEDPAGGGPLAALAAGGAWLRAQDDAGPALLLAVDLPRVEPPLLELLRDWRGAATVVPEAGGQLQPVCARYGTDALTTAANLVASDVRALHALLDAVEHDVIPESVWRSVSPPDTFADVDTPEDARGLGIDLTGLA
jgi:molybdopterin-guanine dinucleotide biosynthesis protein A